MEESILYRRRIEENEEVRRGLARWCVKRERGDAHQGDDNTITENFRVIRDPKFGAFENSRNSRIRKFVSQILLSREPQEDMRTSQGLYPQHYQLHNTTQHHTSPRSTTHHHAASHSIIHHHAIHHAATYSTIYYSPQVY